MIERITTDMFGPLTRGHEARYCLAAGFLRPGDVVVDAACGIAYGASVMCAHGDVTYIGVDKDLSEVVIVEPSVVRLIEADLTTWRPEFDFDVAGHYSRPDVFQLIVNEGAARPVTTVVGR